MGVDALSVAKVVIYIIFVQPAIYIFFKHGTSGILGWFYLQVFCILRIVSDAITVNSNKNSKATMILSSVGLAPLLFACMGVLHEA